jgi:hypothetical protein
MPFGIDELGEDELPEQPARRLTATAVHSAVEKKRIGRILLRVAG